MINHFTFTKKKETCLSLHLEFFFMVKFTNGWYFKSIRKWWLKVTFYWNTKLFFFFFALSVIFWRAGPAVATINYLLEVSTTKSGNIRRNLDCVLCNNTGITIALIFLLSILILTPEFPNLSTADRLGPAGNSAIYLQTWTHQTLFVKIRTSSNNQQYIICGERETVGNTWIHIYQHVQY